jgi:hypothetical protein
VFFAPRAAGSVGQKNRSPEAEKAGKIFWFVPHWLEWKGPPDEKVGSQKIFIAKKARTSYYRFCGYGNYENTYFFLG